MNARNAFVELLACCFSVCGGLWCFLLLVYYNAPRCSVLCMIYCDIAPCSLLRASCCFLIILYTSYDTYCHVLPIGSRHARVWLRRTFRFQERNFSHFSCPARAPRPARAAPARTPRPAPRPPRARARVTGGPAGAVLSAVAMAAGPSWPCTRLPPCTRWPPAAARAASPAAPCPPSRRCWSA
jgi:hypothetical protein